MVFSLWRPRGGCRSLSLLRAAQGRPPLDDLAAHPILLLGILLKSSSTVLRMGPGTSPLLSEHLVDFVCTGSWTQHPLGCWCAGNALNQLTPSICLRALDVAASSLAAMVLVQRPDLCANRGLIWQRCWRLNLGLLETCWCHQGGVHMECMMVTAGVVHQSTSGFRSPVLETAESRRLNVEWGWVKCPY